MLQFETWDDFKKFVSEYTVCSCFNCTGFHSNEDEEFNGRFICWRTLSPVWVDMLHICTEWGDKDGHTLKDFEDKENWKFSSETGKKLDELEGCLTIEEVREVIKKYEEDNE